MPALDSRRETRGFWLVLTGTVDAAVVYFTIAIRAAKLRAGDGLLGVGIVALEDIDVVLQKDVVLPLVQRRLVLTFDTV